MITLPDNINSSNLFNYLGGVFGNNRPEFPPDYIPTVFLLDAWQVPTEPNNPEYWDLRDEQYWAEQLQSDNLPEKYL